MGPIGRACTMRRTSVRSVVIHCMRHYVRMCGCVSTVRITVIWQWRHQRNRINSVTGRLAQLVERTLSMREVEGSKPSLSTTFYFSSRLTFSFSSLNAILRLTSTCCSRVPLKAPHRTISTHHHYSQMQSHRIITLEMQERSHLVRLIKVELKA